MKRATTGNGHVDDYFLAHSLQTGSLSEIPLGEEYPLELLEATVPDTSAVEHIYIVQDRIYVIQDIESGQLRQTEPWSTGPTDTPQISAASEDVTSYEEDEWSALRIAAKAGDESAVLETANRIDWTGRTVDEFESTIRMALAGGAHLLARDLAQRGVKNHPQSEKLQKIARILSPPRVSQAPPDDDTSGRKANREWLNRHSGSYRGQWVALRDGELLASAPTAKQLRERIEISRDVLLTRIF